jgi:DnaJ-class molecular chaperone
MVRLSPVPAFPEARREAAAEHQRSLDQALGVAPDAGEGAIKAAYHALAKSYHPDRFQSKLYDAATRSKAEKAFTYITGAYATLSDPAKRASYDNDRLHRDSQVEASLQAR